MYIERLLYFCTNYLYVHTVHYLSPIGMVAFLPVRKRIEFLACNCYLFFSNYAGVKNSSFFIRTKWHLSLNRVTQKEVSHSITMVRLLPTKMVRNAHSF